MPFKLYISTLNSPTGAVVISQLNATAQPIRDFVLGNTLDTNLYLVDGLGDFDDASGADGYSVIVGIGIPGEGSIELNSAWTQITNGWNGNLALTDTRLAALFDPESETYIGENPARLTMEVRVTDGQSRIISEALIPIKVYNHVIDPDDLVTPPTVPSAFGIFSIPDASDSGTVTSLNLAATPRGVILTVRKPAGGVNISASLVDAPTSDGFAFTLTGQTDSANYKLQYLLFF